MFSKSMEIGRGTPGEDKVSNQDVYEEVEMDREEILEGMDDRSSLLGEGACGLSLAVGGVEMEELLVSTVDLPLNKEDLITVLSPELALHLFMFVDPEDLLELAQTCHTLRLLSEDDKLWESKCNKANLPYCLDSAEKDLLQHVITMNSSLQEILKRLNRMEASFEFSHWKANFLKHLRQLCKPCGIEKNFRQNPIRRPTVLKLVDDRYTCMEFVGDKIVSVSATRGFETSILKIWDPSSGICLFNLEGHTDVVTTIQVHNHLFISGSLDGSFKMWNANTGECVHTLQGLPDMGIVSAHLYNEIIASGSENGTVRLQCVFGGPFYLFNFRGYHSGVRCVRYNGRLVASGSRSSTVKIWNPNTNECVHTCRGHTGLILHVLFAGNHVVSSSTDKSIKVWDVEDGTCTHTFEDYECETMCLSREIVKIWDTRTWECLKVLDDSNKHSEVVNAVDFDDKFLVTGSRDGKVKIWDIKTGDFIRDVLVLKQGGQGTQVMKIRMKDAMIACSIVRRNGSKEIQVYNFDHVV